MTHEASSTDTLPEDERSNSWEGVNSNGAEEEDIVRRAR